MARALHMLKEITSFITVFIILILLLTSAAVAFYSLVYLPQYIGEMYFAIPFYVVIPIPVLIAFATGTYAYAWYVFLVIVISVSLMLFLYPGVPDYMKKLTEKPLSYKNTSIQEFSELYAAILFLVVAVTYIMYFLGVKVQGIGLEKQPTYVLMLNLLHASFYEELVVRFVFLGIPVYLYSLARSRKIPWYRIFGGNYEIGLVEIIIVLFSAAVFGIAHTPAWGWWKFVPTFIAGIVMGYLYLRYGMHYSIMFHFLTDYWTIAGNLNTQVGFVMDMLTMVILIAGVVFTVSYGIRLLQYFGVLGGGRHETEGNKPNAPKPSADYEKWIDVRCPNCGGQVFIYLDDGKLKCTNCGTVFEPSYPERSPQSTREDSLPPPPL